MTHEEAVAEARRLLVTQLDVPRPQALRLARDLEEFYAEQIASASPEELITAASWAVERLSSLASTGELADMNRDEIRRVLYEGCPLCAYSGSGQTSERKPALSG